MTANGLEPYNAFREDVTAEDIQQEIESQNAKGETVLEPPVYVSSVTYGRKVLVTVDCDDSNLDIKADLQASFAGVGGGASANYEKLQKHCKFQMAVIGGSPEDSGKFITIKFDELMKAFKDTTAYKDGDAIPVAYSTRFLKDGQPAESHYVGERWVPSTTVARSAMDLTISMDEELKEIDPSAQGITMVYGKRLESMDKDGNMTYSDNEELLFTDQIEYVGNHIYTIRGDIDPASIRIVAINKGKYPMVLSMPLEALDDTVLQITPQTKRISVWYDGHNYEDEEDAWRKRSETNIFALPDSDQDGYYGRASIESWSKNEVDIFANGKGYTISYTEPQIELPNQETTATTEAATTTAEAATTITDEATTTTPKATTTVPSDTAPASSANDILTTASSSSATTFSTETISSTTEAVNTDNWFTTLTKFEEMAIRDYVHKNGKRPTAAETTLEDNGIIRIVLLDVKGENVKVLARYYVDPVTGKGYDNKNEAVNLPQTGNNSPAAAAVAGLAVLMIAAGCFTVMKCGMLRKKEQ